MNRDKDCPYCRTTFTPHPHLGPRQITCGRDDCKRRQKLLAHKRWKDKNLKIYLDNQVDWRGRHPDYWKTYRKEHPDYAERNRVQTRLRKSRSKDGLQKRIVNLQPFESLAYFINIPRFAKLPRSISLLFSPTARGYHTGATARQGGPP